jgi:hypothetical protein
VNIELVALRILVIVIGELINKLAVFEIFIGPLNVDEVATI